VDSNQDKVKDGIDHPIINNKKQEKDLKVHKTKNVINQMIDLVEVSIQPGSLQREILNKRLSRIRIPIQLLRIISSSAKLAVSPQRNPNKYKSSITI